MAWLSDYTYRKKITIAGQVGASTNYQIKLLIGESSGATGENFDIVEHCEAFPSARDTSGDIRFTAADGSTELSFWVQKVSGATPNRLATIYVKVTADLGSNQDIYCYYGKSGVANASSGANTFVDFGDPTTMAASWTITNNAYAICPANNFKRVVDGETWSVRTYISSTCPGVSRVWGTEGHTGRLAAEGFVDALFGHRNSTSINQTFSATSPNALTGTYSVLVALSAGYKTGSAIDIETRLRRGTTNIAVITTHNTFIETEYTNNAFSSEAFNIYSVLNNNTSTCGIGYIAIRKWQATEPAFSSASSEEEEPDIYSASLTLTPSITKLVEKSPFSGTITLSGGTLLAKVFEFVTSLTLTAINEKVIYKVLNSPLSISPKILKTYFKIVNPTLSLSASVRKKIFRLLQVTINLGGNIINTFSLLFNGTINLSSSVTKNISKRFSTVVTLGGDIIDLAKLTLEATINLSISFTIAIVNYIIPKIIDTTKDKKVKIVNVIQDKKTKIVNITQDKKPKVYKIK